MARDVKDELNPEPQDPSFSQTTPDQKNPQGSVQLTLSEDLQRVLVQTVLEDYDHSKKARAKLNFGTTAKGEIIDFTRWIKDIRDLYNARREAKTVPWKFCSNRSLRIAASILDTLHARLFPAVVNEDLLRWRPGEITDVPKVERISKLMHWWIWVRSRMRTFFDDWVKSVIGYGNIICESSWKVVPVDKGETISTPITDPQGNQLTNPDGTPAVETSRKIDLFESSSSKLYMPDEYFLQEGSTDIDREPVILEDTLLYRELEEGESENKFVNVSAVLKDKIPYARPSTIGLDPSEEERVKAIRIRNHPVKLLKWYGQFDADGDGFAEDVRILVSPEYDLYLGGVAVHSLTKTGKRPLTFTKFESRFDHPDWNWGLGIIEKVKELAEEVDALFNQLSDAHTLASLLPGFYDPGGDVDAPALKLAPNRMVPVSNPQQNIFFPQLNPPTDRIIVQIRLVLEFIERLTAASSYILGKESEIVGGSGTATRTNAIVSSAEQRFALPSERLREGASKIIRQHLDLLQLNIPPGLETRVLGEKGEPLFSENELTQEGIAGEYDAYLLEDPSQGSKETERQIFAMFYSLLLQNVLVGTDPVKIYKVTADLIKAYGKDPQEYLGPEPKLDNVDEPEDENTLIVQGDFDRVRAQLTENHMQHIKVHEDLLNSPSLVELSANAPNLAQQIVAYVQQHILEHMQMMQMMTNLMAKFSGGKPNAGAESRAGTGTSKTSQGTGLQPGMENVQGPLGEALNQKRAGQSGSSPGFSY